jgi:hypothetical protein
LLNGESAIPQALFDEMYLTATTALSEDVTARRLVLLSEAAARGGTVRLRLKVQSFFSLKGSTAKAQQK